MLKWSKYNHLLKREGEFMIYNSLSNSFAKMTEPLWNDMAQFEVGKPVEGLSEELMSDLKRMKAIVESDEIERLRIKFRTQQLRFSQDFLSLTICPTLSCNFRCGYCFEHGHPDIDMTDETEDMLIEFIKNHTQAKQISVTWFGGEPLLQFNRIKSLTRKIVELGKSYGAGIITNGYLLNENVAKQLLELQIGSVQITLDGLAETHDKRRFLKNGGPTYQRIIDNVGKAVKVAPELKISIRVNIDGNNTEDYLAIHDYIKSQGWRNVNVSPAFVGDYSEGNCGLMLKAAKRRELLELYSNATGEKYIHFYPSGFRNECSIRNPNVYVIGPEGEIYKCWNDVGDPKRIVGDISGKVKNERLLLDYMSGADPLEDPKCLDCIMFPQCGGGCPYARLNGMPSEDLCPLIKFNLDDFLWRKYLEYKKESEK